jgi:hypothetical protein
MRIPVQRYVASHGEQIQDVPQGEIIQNFDSKGGFGLERRRACLAP